MKRVFQLPTLRGASSIVLPFLLGGCGVFGDRLKEHEEICRAEARVIVHDPKLWDEYLQGAQQTYQKRQDRNPDLKTERVVTEYVEGFEQRFGDKLEESRGSKKVGITRDDVYIFKGSKNVAQFVDFLHTYRHAGGLGAFSCLNNHPELYSLEPVSHE